MELDTIINQDCLIGMRQLPDKCVDLIVTDPPYQFKDTTGAGAFGTCRGKSTEKKGRTYHKEVEPMADGIKDEHLEEMCRVCKAPNIYLFCNKDQVPQYLNFAISHKLNFDILTWHKTDPTPMCGNKYLSDTEYIIFMRAKGVKVYGSYETKRKFFITQSNTEDKKMWEHPTIKPLNIIQTLIINSSQPGNVVLDPFMGSGTTAIASIQSHHHYLGYEISEQYYQTACERIKQEQNQLKLF